MSSEIEKLYIIGEERAIAESRMRVYEAPAAEVGKLVIPNCVAILHGRLPLLDVLLTDSWRAARISGPDSALPIVSTAIEELNEEQTADRVISFFKGHEPIHPPVIDPDFADSLKRWLPDNFEFVDIAGLDDDGEAYTGFYL